VKAGIRILLVISAAVISAAGQIATFEHVVVIVQENRTPDSLFYNLCVPPYGSAGACSATPGPGQYNIQTTNWLNNTSGTGVTQPISVPLDNTFDLGHSHPSFVQMCDVNTATGICRMDGAAGISCGPKCAKNSQYRFVDNSTGILNPYLELATQYGWANYMFQTNQGPSFPAHQFLFGGTSAPSAADDAAGIFASENPGSVAMPVGCAAPAQTRVDLIDSSGSETDKIYPCFEHNTMPDLLPAKVTWEYYAPSPGSIWNAPNAIQHICMSTGPGGRCAGEDWTNNVDLKPADVLTDVANCTLRSLSWVIPAGANSDHADLNDGGGPSWVASIVNAIGNSNNCDGNTGYWKNTAIFITWDDWGGWYDHEPPTILTLPEGDYQYGFRVPLIVVSAYTPVQYIDNTRYDFGSLLRFIEFNFGIPEGALNFADARASTDLTNFFQLGQPPRAFQTINAPLKAEFFIKDKRPPTDPDNDQ
jgi:phospholipase C